MLRELNAVQVTETMRKQTLMKPETAVRMGCNKTEHSGVFVSVAGYIYFSFNQMSLTDCLHCHHGANDCITAQRGLCEPRCNGYE